VSKVFTNSTAADLHLIDLIAEKVTAAVSLRLPASNFQCSECTQWYYQFIFRKASELESARKPCWGQRWRSMQKVGTLAWWDPSAKSAGSASNLSLEAVITPALEPCGAGRGR
jgi:hypothetical protein